MKFERLESKASVLVPYESAWKYQHEILARVIAREKDSERILFCEHEPVVTRGRGLQKKQPTDDRFKQALRQVPLQNKPENVSYYEVERGGDLTWHGPGQLTIYPILNLEAYPGGLHGYLRNLEEWVMAALAGAGLKGCERKQDASGVWLGGLKIASLGIACRKWVSYHGIGLNLTNDLGAQAFMSPCGYAPETMTNYYTEFMKQRGHPPDLLGIRTQIETELVKNISKIETKSDTSSLTLVVL